MSVLLCKGGRTAEHAVRFVGLFHLGICVSVFRAQELCESRGGRPGLPVPNRHYDFCGRKAARKKEEG